jgi:hypothetical protein
MTLKGRNSSTSIDSNTNDTSNEDDIIIDGNNFTNDVQCVLGILYEKCQANGIGYC